MKKTYILFLTIILCVSTMYSAIIYTDVNPDFTHTMVNGNQQDLYSIDFDGNGSEEFNFRYDEYTMSNLGWYLHLTIPNNSSTNNIWLTGNSNLYNAAYINVISEGTMIGPNILQGDWGNSLPEPLIGDNANPNFQNQGDKYIGVRFLINQLTHYGWIHITFDNNKKLTVKGFAYESTALTSIAAGDTGENSENILVNSISINGENGQSEVNNNGTLQMIANILPSNASNQNVSWTVTNGTGQASIDNDGLLTGESIGNVTVKATAVDGSNSFGTVEISVIEPIMVNYITVSGENGQSEVIINNTLQMSVSILPTSATNQNVNWTVTNGTGQASIDTNGLLTGESIGSVTVKATAVDGSFTYGTIGVSVIEEQAILVNNITVYGENDQSEVLNSSTLQMVANILPSNATNQNVNWTVTNGTGQASIDTNGLLTGESIGNVTVKATAMDGSGITDSTEIVIIENSNIQITSITVQGENGATSVDINSYLQMEATLLPENATNPIIAWTVINSNGTAFISDEGMLSPTSTGEVIVKAVAQDGSNLSGQETINITQAVGLATFDNENTRIFPNPTSSHIFIHSSKEIEQISLYSIDGKTILNKKDAKSLMLSNIENGSYIIRITYGDNTSEIRLIQKQ